MENFIYHGMTLLMRDTPRNKMEFTVKQDESLRNFCLQRSSSSLPNQNTNPSVKLSTLEENSRRITLNLAKNLFAEKPHCYPDCLLFILFISIVMHVT